MASQSLRVLSAMNSSSESSAHIIDSPITSYALMKKQRASMVTKEILLPSVSTPPKNRTTVKLSSKRQGRLATATLLGVAPVRLARASAANHWESISACRHDVLGVANGKVTFEVTNYVCS